MSQLHWLQLVDFVTGCVCVCARACVCVCARACVYVPMCQLHWLQLVDFVTGCVCVCPCVSYTGFSWSTLSLGVCVCPMCPMCQLHWLQLVDFVTGCVCVGTFPCVSYTGSSFVACTCQLHGPCTLSLGAYSCSLVSRTILWYSLSV